MGDTYTGKVVKTTEFGAFVELKKGTDGLLHVSNVGPGRVAHIEDVMARGDVVDVIVQEVDKDRGRIGLKLVAQARERRARAAGGADRAGEERAVRVSRVRSARRAREAAAAIAVVTAGHGATGQVASSRDGPAPVPRSSRRRITTMEPHASDDAAGR